MLLPTFYYPTGRPVSAEENDATLSKIEQLFESRPQGLCRLKHFAEISKVIGLPVYSKKAVYEAVCQCSNLSPNTFPNVSFENFATYWNEMIEENHDKASRFIFTLSVARTGLPSRSYLEREDFKSILYDIVLTHPGLFFCVNLSTFRPRYVEMVITRIFWNCTRAWWTNKFTADQLRKSNVLETFHLLERTDTRLPGFLSYEQFYVVYAKFWELDGDHDMKLSPNDLKNYGNGTTSDMVVERIFSDAISQKKVSYHNGNPVKQNKKETIGFEEFAAFLLAEEDKRHPTAIEYWFRCLDLDGDGIISLYEMEIFYGAMVEKVLANNYDHPVEFREIASQLHDVVSPRDGKNFTLRDVKRCGLAHRFFNPLVSCAKFIHRELNEIERSSVKIYGEKEISEWDQFCAIEFQMLSLKEDQMEDEEEGFL